MSAPLFSAAGFRELVSGRRRGLTASAARAALSLAELIYAPAMRLRNLRYDRSEAASQGVGVPVVCVGNLTLGGTGKTPMVEWIARRLREREIRVAIVSRGYGVEAGARNDEAIELEEKLPDVPHLQNVDRVEGARTAIEEFESQAILLDDGFQHRRLKRDLDVVLIDALEPFGYGHVFPRGLLREPLSGLKRAGVVVLSRADLVDEAERTRIRDEVRRRNAAAIWCEVRHAPRALLSSAGPNVAGIETPLESLRGKRVVGFCGIGNPEGFRRTLVGLGCDLVDFREFPDHHAYQRADVEALTKAALDANAEVLVCTHKDLVKLRIDSLAGRPLKAVVVGVEFLVGETELVEKLEAVVPAIEG